MLNNLVIIGLYFSRLSDEFLDSGVDRQPVIQWGLRVLKIVGIQGQSSKNLNPWTPLLKIAPEIPLFSIHKDLTVLLVAYKPLDSGNPSEILRKVPMAISFHMVCKKHKDRFFTLGKCRKNQQEIGSIKKYRKNK
jgi:hypothetical protein